jgi:hypothetical protein
MLASVSVHVMEKAFFGGITQSGFADFQPRGQNG